jgi:hypothetical protein
MGSPPRVSRRGVRKDNGWKIKGKDLIVFQGLEIAIRYIVVLGALLEDTLVNLFPVHLHFGWCIDTDTYLVPLNAQYRDRYIFPDDEFFSHPPG